MPSPVTIRRPLKRAAEEEEEEVVKQRTEMPIPRPQTLRRRMPQATAAPLDRITIRRRRRPTC